MMRRERGIPAEVRWIKYFNPAVCHLDGIRHSQYRGGRYYKGDRVLHAGNGNPVVQIQPESSGLAIGVVIYESTHTVWVGKILKSILDARTLTSKLRKVIIDSLPSQVEVVEVMGRNDVKHYELCDESARDWAREARLKMEGVDADLF